MSRIAQEKSLTPSDRGEYAAGYVEPDRTRQTCPEQRSGAAPTEKTCGVSYYYSINEGRGPPRQEMFTTIRLQAGSAGPGVSTLCG